MTSQSEWVIQTDNLLLGFDTETGVLNRVHAWNTGWEILGANDNGLSWQILLPLGEELRHNDIFGERQKLSSVERQDDALIFRWDRVVSERGGEHEINVEMRVSASGMHALFEMTVINNSIYTVENVYCPCLINIAPPEDAAWLKVLSHHNGRGNETPLWPDFSTNLGYFGVDFPTQIIGCSPATPFILARSPLQGLYMGIASPVEETVAWIAELRPGYISVMDSDVPTMGEIAGKPVQTRLSALHVPFILPGETRTLPTIALAAYEGGWQEGADIYTAWRGNQFPTAKSPAWAREPHAWQQLHINSPEDELRLHFNDLPKVAETCRKNGVSVIQLVGWNDGGQDQGNPSHDPDPRLGTFDDLKNAITACQSIGVKVVLFTKFTWADRATKAFREEYHHYASKDPYGDYHVFPGYKYQTGTQLLDINTKRLVPMCFGSEEYLALCEREFRKIIDLGADGMLFDECMIHGYVLQCFDESHGHRYGWPVYSNDRELIKRFRKTPGIPEEFLMTGEACYDWEMEVYQIAYCRTYSRGHIPIHRYMRPNAQYMSAITGFNDRNMVNQCLMYGMIISYEPFNFKGSLEDFPDTIAYGKRMDALRTEFREWFWDGTFRGTAGVLVKNLEGAVHEPYGVFRAVDGSLGVVVCNYENQSITVKVERINNGCFTRSRLVDGEEWMPIQDGIFLPPRSAALLL